MKTSIKRAISTSVLMMLGITAWGEHVTVAFRLPNGKRIEAVVPFTCDPDKPDYDPDMEELELEDYLSPLWLAGAITVGAVYLPGEIYEKLTGRNLLAADVWPKLKPRTNCFMIGNSSKKTWTLKVPDNAKYTGPISEFKGRSETGGILVYRMCTKKDVAQGAPNAKNAKTRDGLILMLKGDLTDLNKASGWIDYSKRDVENKSIDILPGEVFILYLDVPKFMGVKYADFFREFQFIDSNSWIRERLRELG